MNTQYKKGVLELCLLSLLKKRDHYGYEISDYLSSHIDIADGTVYPILRKLKGDGLLTTYLQEESGGPPRKYYSLTSLGRETYERDKAEYLSFAHTIEKLLEDLRGSEPLFSFSVFCRITAGSAPFSSGSHIRSRPSATAVWILWDSANRGSDSPTI